MTHRTMRDRAESAIYVPPGWPEAVRPPGAPDWEVTATAWLFDQCPADFRAYAVLRHHPVVLAGFATRFVESQLEATRSGLAGVRASLGDHVAPQVIDSAAEAWQRESAHLVRVRRGVALVEEALRGTAFVRRL